MLAVAIAEAGLTQVAAANLLGADQPTISKVVSGKAHGVTIERLMDWLLRLGRSVEISVVGSSESGPSLSVTRTGEQHAA